MLQGLCANHQAPSKLSLVLLLRLPVDCRRVCLLPCCWCLPCDKRPRLAPQLTAGAGVQLEFNNTVQYVVPSNFDTCQTGFDKFATALAAYGTVLTRSADGNSITMYGPKVFTTPVLNVSSQAPRKQLLVFLC